ncbi:hypothetical protein WMY93_021752 [Mugilogobius chulae]|uniref:Haloacid dehalogenase-like hydrolase domain-containing protein 2 n=1 Tax=Mugilogobius chulae TaxID=88201 RepID=A0AAW0NGI9_9GOBI
MLVCFLHMSKSKLCGVQCDVCSEPKLKALKSCLVCCPRSVRPTFSLISQSGLKRHQLMEPVENLEDRMCPTHQRLLELFCATDEKIVCTVCVPLEHKNHELLSLEEACEHKRSSLLHTQTQTQYMVEQRRQKIQEIQRSVELSDREHCPALTPPAGLKDWSSVRFELKTCEGSVARAMRELEKSISEELVHHTDVEKQLRDSPLRFDFGPCVLTKQSFSSGRFYFEVQVKGKTAWTLGVAKESVNRKGKIGLSPAHGLWCIVLINTVEYKACADPSVRLSPERAPQKVEKKKKTCKQEVKTSCSCWNVVGAGRMCSRRALKAVLIDLSGTLHVEDAAVPGAQEALRKLRQASVAVKFVTNTTKESKRNLLDRLTRLNFELQEQEVFTSLTAARSLLEQTQLRPLLLLDNSALEDFTGIDTSDPNAVVIGLAPDQFNYHNMNKAFRLILSGAPLIAVHKARYYQRKDGLALGPGPFVSGLEYATDCRATVVGKPEETFFKQALSDLGCSASEAVMIGDDARDDVGGAQNAGMLGILVKTGKYREGDELKISPAPHLTCDSFPHAVEHILQNLL